MEFASGLGSVLGIALDETELFWTTAQGSVKAQRLDRTVAPRTLATLGAAGHLEVDAEYAYVATYADKTIVRIPKTGGSAQTIATCLGNCLGVVLFGSRVYFTDRGSGSLRLVENDGGSTFIAGGMSQPEDAVGSGADIFVSDEGASKVFKITPPGNASVTLASVPDAVSAAVDGPTMFVVSQQFGTIYRMNSDGSGVTALVTDQAAGGYYPVSVALTKKALYWSRTDGRIFRLAR